MSIMTHSLLDFLRETNLLTLKKGVALYHNSLNIMLIEEEDGIYHYQVESSGISDKIYLVDINTAVDTAECDCTCPAFGQAGNCKHIVAALIDLLIFEEEDSPFSEPEEIVKALHDPSMYSNPEADNDGEPGGPVTEAGEPGWKSFRTRVSDIWHHLEWHVRREKVLRPVLNATTLVSHPEHAAVWNFVYKGPKKDTHDPIIRYDGQETFSYYCGCSTNFQMCKHVAAAFEILHYQDSRVFLKYRNFDTEKTTFLAQYGLTLSDPEVSDFKFQVDSWGGLSVTVPPWILKANDKAALLKFRNLLAPLNKGKKSAVKPQLPAGQLIDFRLGFLLNLNSQKLKLGFEFEVFKIYSEPGAAKNNFKKLVIHTPGNMALLQSLPGDIYEIIESLTEQKLKEWLRDQGFGFVMNYASPFVQLTGESMKLLRTHYISQLQKLWPWLAEQPEVFTLPTGKFSNQSLVPVKLQMPLVKLKAELVEDERVITVKMVPQADGKSIGGEVLALLHDFMFLSEGKAWMIETVADSETLAIMPKGVLIIPASEKLSLVKNLLPGLQERYDLQLPASFAVNRVEAEPVAQILLKEYQDLYLMLQPQFTYAGELVDFEHQPEDILLTMADSSLQLIARDNVFETDFYTGLRQLHPSFKNQRQNAFYYLPFAEVMKNNWFINTVNSLQEKNVPVLGIKELKKFRYNTNKPKWEMKAGSGIDWFELKIEVSFGDEIVPLKDIRKALLNRQNVVLLGDGTFGVLPEEWLKQYGMLLKMGDEQKNGVLHLSKLHFTLIDELHEQLDDQAIMVELNFKKQKLDRMNSIQPVAHSKAINARLRPYQVSGFNWLHTLDELGWGGCLADDMGLGKTLQAITFLQYVKEKYAGSTHLIVCPTSLIYNWENELKKFAPTLKYHIYYGKDREFSDEHFEDYDLVITSYGIIRSDLADLLKFHWHYVILDESQAIKNPDAQTTKAVQLLKCKNRVIMSGTPVQNNTFDLYAQFQFINPGLLGNREFFRTEFANPIDKNNDAEKSAALRRLVYPFLLRRTKEQVAIDLPNKTEMILWCEMEKEQRAVYNEYKNYYRNALLKKIEEVGMAKAGMYVLEGLLRLRQICDSPVLVKSEDVTTTASVKIEELMREIKENTGNHKLLVFSQFTEMLALLETAMKESNILYSYLDGSTPAHKRQEAVDEFQNNEKVKVFLISLKAGGIGLNLTAADYVYIVDPWWNPAVEQQAIDRTHRIGQTRKIFAYRMICKDTVEEKIVELQQRKKQLASDLVTEDAGFIKKLTRDDIAFLFS